MGITHVDEGVEKRREKSRKERNFPRYLLRSTSTAFFSAALKAFSSLFDN